MKESTLAQKFKGSVTVKIVFILFIIILLMIPNMMIKNLIRERSSRKAEIEREVAKSFGESQTIMAPFLRIPYTKIVTDKEDKATTIEGHINIAPQSTVVNGKAITDTRKRSIYEVVVFNSEIDIQERFKVDMLLDEATYKNYTFDYTKTKAVFSIADANGISDNTAFNVNGKTLKMVGNANITGGRLTKIATEVFTIDPAQEIVLGSSLIFKGTKSLNIEPLGDKMQITITSNWPDPSYVGKRSPSDYNNTEEGFVSNWKTNRFSHDYPDIWQSDTVLNKKNHSFGVNFIQPIDDYGKNTRTAKYALLIISLTFGIFFFFEILYKQMIHPIQYILIGFALTIFYLLLISITEHMGFNSGYAISSIATIGLITAYTRFILKTMKGSTIIGGLLFGLFGYVFVILQMQDFALLAGAVALFVILATVMLLSRNVDWYNLNEVVEN